MFIESTNENLFNKEDIYESLISHCGLEYASSVFRLLGSPVTNKEFDEKQSRIIFKTNKEQRHILLSWKYPEVRTAVQSNKEQSTV